MHILKRSIGESVLIDDDIHVTILDVRGSQAWIGISDPVGKLEIGAEQADSPDNRGSKSAAPLLSGQLLTGD